jgi:hypothetical protein
MGHRRVSVDDNADGQPVGSGTTSEGTELFEVGIGRYADAVGGASRPLSAHLLIREFDVGDGGGREILMTRDEARAVAALAMGKAGCASATSSGRRWSRFTPFDVRGGAAARRRGRRGDRLTSP